MGELNFNAIYENNRWTKAGNGSGPGSTLENTKKIRKFLIEFIRENEITSIIDISCGGMNWWTEILLQFKDITFYGFDVSSFIIEKNKDKFKEQENWHFSVKDASKNIDYPKADLILCRHTLQHLSMSNSVKIVNNLKSSNTKFICLTSHDVVNENPSVDNHIKLLENTPGCFKFRPMNMHIEPFNLLEPFTSIADDDEYGQSSLKQNLSIWKNQK